MHDLYYPQLKPPVKFGKFNGHPNLVIIARIKNSAITYRNIRLLLRRGRRTTEPVSSLNRY